MAQDGPGAEARQARRAASTEQSLVGTQEPVGRNRGESAGQTPIGGWWVQVELVARRGKGGTGQDTNNGKCTDI